MSDTPDLPTAGGGMPDLNSLLAAAEQMGQQLMAKQAQAASRVVTGSAGGGAVKVEINGGFECSAVAIAPTVVEDIEMLQDLVVAAVNDALNQLSGDDDTDLGGMLGGLDLGGLDIGGLLGGSHE